MKSIVDGETRFVSDQFVFVEHSAEGSPIRSRGVATKAGIWVAGGGDVRGKRVWRPPDVVEKAVLTNFRNFYAGNHPAVEDESFAAGKIIQTKYDPSTQSIVYDMDYYPNKGRPELTEAILRKTPVPNSVKSRAIIDWTPGMVDGQSYDGRELSLELLHLAEVSVGACNPEDGCGIGLHCSCSKSKVTPRGTSMLKAYEGEINPAVIQGFLDTAEKLPEADRAEKAIGFLLAIGQQFKEKIGMFALPKLDIEAPKVAEHGAYTWEKVSDYATIKPAVEAVIAAKDGQITTLTKDLTEAAAKLKVYIDKEVAEEMEARKAIMTVISEHSGFSPETLKVFEKNSTEELFKLAKDLKLVPETAEHHSWLDVKNIASGAGTVGTQSSETTPMRKPGTVDPKSAYLEDLKTFYSDRGVQIPEFLVKKYDIKGV